MTMFPDNQWQEAAPTAVGLDGKRLAAALSPLARITGHQAPHALPPHDKAAWYRQLPGHYGYCW